MAMIQVDKESENGKIFYAHTPPKGSDTWHNLAEHLVKTAKLAASFGRTKFEKQNFFLAGLLHDLGKYQDPFQDYLKASYNGKSHEKVQHAVFGAVAAFENKLPEVAFVIAGHHAGIPNRSDLKNKLQEIREQCPGKVEKLLNALEQDTGCAIAESKIKSPEIEEYEFDTNVRLLYSALVDADFLNTENHFDRERAKTRVYTILEPDSLISKLNHRFDSFSTISPINKLRTEARQQCLQQSSSKPGFFSLVLPTGLGKTLTSVSWALEHARHNSQRRLIVVLPYTNIIDQTAKELKDIFGEDMVLEHHSGIAEKDDAEGKYDPRKLATENWDFPIVVTTTVQFFESLFSNRSSKCRKIHNIADSVVIFDEVQTLPKESIKPTLQMLRDIQRVFQTSFLFCTATMPAFEKRTGFLFGLENMTPLIKNPLPFFEATRRVEYSFIDNLEEIEVSELMQIVSKSLQSALVIFNAKKDALNFYQETSSEGWDRKFHLSTSMCPHHRKSILEEIKTDLKNGRKIIAITTQLVEAGVDFDFPAVFRAIAPLDSIIQAAGRCNREGMLKDKQGKLVPGQVYIFRTKNMGMPYDKTYKTATEFSAVYIQDKLEKLFSPECYAEYYGTLMKNFINEDRAGIDDMRRNLQFADTARDYKIIDSPATAVFIKEYNNKSMEIFNGIRHKPYLSRKDHASMQPFIVQLYPALMKSAAGFIHELENGTVIWSGDYDKDTGIKVEFDSTDYIV